MDCTKYTAKDRREHSVRWTILLELDSSESLCVSRVRRRRTRPREKLSSVLGALSGRLRSRGTKYLHTYPAVKFSCLRKSSCTTELFPVLIGSQAASLLVRIHGLSQAEVVW